MGGTADIQSFVPKSGSFDCFFITERMNNMCGIIVAQQREKDLEKAILKIKDRGPDDTKIMTVDGHVFMFNRLSIMGLSDSGMQPFTMKGSTLVANGEIYNYKQLKQELEKSYTFRSESDCEVLLPLYEKLGTDMFKILDAEFALVLFDAGKKSLVAGRDPIGIRPLFYGYSKLTKEIIFSSEVKGIIELVDQVKAFPPGYYYSDGEFTKYSDITDVKEYNDDTLDDTLEHIQTKLVNAVIKRLDSDAPMGFLLSGGLDSSLVCSIAANYLKKPIRTFSIGMVSDPIDLKYAKTVADYLGTDHTEVTITKEDILTNLESLIYASETYDITTIRAGMGMHLICKYIHENTDIKVIHTGEVSDELFGYKYLNLVMLHLVNMNQMSHIIQNMIS